MKKAETVARKFMLERGHEVMVPKFAAITAAPARIRALKMSEP